MVKCFCKNWAELHVNYVLTVPVSKFNSGADGAELAVGVLGDCT